MSADKRIAEKLDNLIYDLERLDIWLDNPASDMTLGEYEDKRKEIIESCAKSIEEMLGAGTCIYVPDEMGFTWWDENDVEHYEEHSASDECCSASCDKCGNQMMVGDDGWFNGWDEITEWWEEDGSYHKGYVLEPRFKRCPNCGARLVGA